MNSCTAENLYLPSDVAYEKLLKEVDRQRLVVYHWHDENTGQFCIMPRYAEDIGWIERLNLYDLYLAAIPEFIDRFSLEHKEEEDFAAILAQAAGQGGSKCEPSKQKTNTKCTASPGVCTERQTCFTYEESARAEER